MRDPLTGSRILLIDDDPDILELMEMIFSEAGAQIATALTSAEGLRQFYAFRPDLVLLDLMMPDMSGWEVCTRLRELSDVPIIMLTALNEPDNIARALQCGADDYVTKPYHKPVLLARIRAVLRRAALAGSDAERQAYDDGYLSVDLSRHEVRIRDQPIRLTPTEYKLLAYLLMRPAQVSAYAQVLEDVWGSQCHDCTQYIHVYLHRLRRKLEPDPARPRYLITQPGVGLRFEPQAVTQL